nr:MAG TPA: hypothetical protein [Caudoviricetes sp.]
MNKRKIVGMLLRAFELDRKIDDELSFQKDFTIPSVYGDLKIELSILPKEGDGGYVKMASEAGQADIDVILEIFGVRDDSEKIDNYSEIITDNEMDIDERLDALFALSEEEDINE